MLMSTITKHENVMLVPESQEQDIDRRSPNRVGAVISQITDGK